MLTKDGTYEEILMTREVYYSGRKSSVLNFFRILSFLPHLDLQNPTFSPFSPNPGTNVVLPSAVLPT